MRGIEEADNCVTHLGSMGPVGYIAAQDFYSLNPIPEEVKTIAIGCCQFRNPMGEGYTLSHLPGRLEIFDLSNLPSPALFFPYCYLQNSTRR